MEKWDGQERRTDDRRIAVLEERIDQFCKTTTEYRKSLCGKIDIITDKLNGLSCKEMFSKIDSNKTEIGWLQKITYTAICLVIPSLIGMGVGWGNLSRIVDTNTSKWAVLEPEHENLLKEMAVLKSIHKQNMVQDEPSRIRP